MFILGMMCVFIGISLLAPDESRGTLDRIFVFIQNVIPQRTKSYCLL